MRQGTIDLFSYGSNCHANFNVIVESTSSECRTLQGHYEEVQSNGNNYGKIIVQAQDLCSASEALACAFALLV